MRTALLLASLLVAATLVAAAPATSAGPVKDACHEYGDDRINCGGLFLPCRSQDPLADHVCTQYYNPLVEDL